MNDALEYAEADGDTRLFRVLGYTQAGDVKLLVVEGDGLLTQVIMPIVKVHAVKRYGRN